MNINEKDFDNMEPEDTFYSKNPNEPYYTGVLISPKQSKFTTKPKGRTSELINYILVLEALVHGLTRIDEEDFVKMRKAVCPNWAKDIQRIASLEDD